MQIIVSCACGAKLRLPESAAGKKTSCPKCSASLRVPTNPIPTDLVESREVASVETGVVTPSVRVAAVVAPAVGAPPVVTSSVINLPIVLDAVDTTAQPIEKPLHVVVTDIKLPLLSVFKLVFRVWLSALVISIAVGSIWLLFVVFFSFFTLR